jgi:O-Antigen ligase
LAFLLGGLFLSFSRGAWAHLAISSAVCFLLLLSSTSDSRLRGRIVLFVVVAAIVLSLLLLALMSNDAVYQVFLERAKAIQPYDVGPGGRFSQQQQALTAILDNPNGMGPFEFARVFGLQQHNVYMQSFLVYGWLGGTTYLALVAITLIVGLGVVRVSTPWQPYLIAAYGAFVGEVVEGMIVDTDHWRHFFLILGLIWGLMAATINYRRRLLE